MTTPPSFDTDCGCVGGPCNPTGRCCSGNVNNDPGDNNSCSEENTGILSSYQWPSTDWYATATEGNSDQDNIVYSRLGYNFNLFENEQCSDSIHDIDETDGATKYNTIATVQNNFCGTNQEGFLTGQYLTTFKSMIILNNNANWDDPEASAVIQIRYPSLTDLIEDYDFIQNTSYEALILKVRVKDQSTIRRRFLPAEFMPVDTDGTSSGVPRLAPEVEVGDVYTYRFPIESDPEKEIIGLKKIWEAEASGSGERILNIQTRDSLDQECSSQWPAFNWKLGSSDTQIVKNFAAATNTPQQDYEKNLWGIEVEYWFYFEGSLEAEGQGIQGDCLNFGSSNVGTCDGNGGTLGDAAPGAFDVGFGCLSFCNEVAIDPNFCVCDICNCLESWEGCFSTAEYRQLNKICACCLGVGESFGEESCPDDCDDCGGFNISCEICGDNCCTDCNRGNLSYGTFDECMTKIDDGNAICWSPVSTFVCPCLSEIVIDECGCFLTTGCEDNSVGGCLNGGCRAYIPSSCGGGEVTKNFFFVAYDKDNNAQDGITFSLSAPYNQQIEYGYCGEFELVNGANGAENDEFNLAFGAGGLGMQILGNMPITFDVFKTCMIKSFTEDGNLVRMPLEETIKIKDIKLCNKTDSGRCGTCDYRDQNGYEPPTVGKGVYTTLKLTNNDIKFQRTNQFNKLIAFKMENGSVSTSSNITTTNDNYTISALENTQSLLDSGFDQTEISRAMISTTERDKVKDDFTKLDSTWYTATYCKNELLQNTEFNNSAYAFLTDNNSGWWSDNLDNTTYLRVWSTQVRSVYKFCYPFSENAQGGSPERCFEDVTNHPSCYFRLDHKYAKDSQTERGIVKSSVDDTGVYKQLNANCEDTSTCVFCNTWTSADDPTNKGCNSYIDASGNFVAETEGAMLMPSRPHTYQVEVWYVTEAGGPCSSYVQDYPTDFKLAGIVQSVPNCLLAAEQLEDTTKQYWTSDTLSYNIYYDSCGSFFWQFKEREDELKSIILNTSYDEDFDDVIEGVESATITRKIDLIPDVQGTTSSYVDRNPEANDIPTIKAVTSQNWNEDVWYHTDPKHDFNLVAKGKPQVMARWTEIPFKNYANEYLDLDKSQLGFYLTVSAAHMDGINSVKFYLDGATAGNGVASINKEYAHPLETSVARVKRGDNGNLLNSLEEYTVRLETSSLTTGVHEVRARVTANSRTDRLGVGTSRLLYGEPPTGNAEVLITGEAASGRGPGDYKNWGPIAGQNWPLSNAKWPRSVPDGPELLKGASGLNYKNDFPAIGSTNKWNLAANGFSYYTSGGAKTFYYDNRYIFGATSQQNILFNGYESFWFNYNPAPVQVTVGNASEVTAGTADVTTVAAAFTLLNTGSVEAARHDAEIILNPGTDATPREYHWPNLKDSESLTYAEGANWCRNALQKKSLVIKSKNPDSKSKTILWFPPGQDKVDMAWNSFALHVKDLTVHTSLTGSSVNQCLKSTGTNCRLLIENVDFASVCVDAVKASTLVDSSGNIICGDSLTRASNGTVAGQIQYNKCRKIRDGEEDYQCSEDATVCGVNCCGILANGTGCADCVTTACNYCRTNCTCRMTEVQWWPFFSSNTVNLSASNGTNIAAEIACSGTYPCTNSALSACKGIFGADLVHTSTSFCLGTEPGQCVILGLYNHDLMELADNDSWTMGIYAKSITSNAVPGPVVKNPVMVKHFTVDNMTDNLICDEGHSLIIDLWVKNIDNYSDPDKKDTDIVKWSLDNYNTKYGIKVQDDYNPVIGSPNPRGVYNFNSFIENRMMINIKVDNCHSRIINMPGPSFTVRDILGSFNGAYAGVAGHKENFGTWTFRNFLFKDFHLDEKANSQQIFGHNAINHLYFDNFVVSSNVQKFCLSTDADTDACKNIPEGPLFPLTDGAVSSLSTKYLHYGRKQIQNLFIKDSVFHNLSTSPLLLQEFYPSSIDYGMAAPNFIGSNFSVNRNRYYWTGSHGVKIRGLRQVKNDYTNTARIPDLANSSQASSFGPVLHYRSSPPMGRTSSANIINSNPFGSSSQWLADSPSAKQVAIFGTDTTNRITLSTPTICATFIQGNVFKTADSKDACYDTTNGTCSGESDPFQFPSEAHSSFVAAIEALSSGNLLNYGVPNVGGMKLSFANTKNYYHDICNYDAFKCTRSGSLDARTNQDEPLTVISYDSGAGTYSWISNTKAECSGNCLNIRDHYFVDSINYPVDLSWIPVVDECTCCDIDSTCTPVS
tara:strand:- start:16064 stop:22750 length:6687 start_codon:yes stop_codon:yes gene_type:complete